MIDDDYLLYKGKTIKRKKSIAANNYYVRVPSNTVTMKILKTLELIVFHERVRIQHAVRNTII